MKKVCIKGNEFNTNYHIIYSADKALENGYSVFEVPDGYEDCCFEDFDNNGFNIELYNARKLKEKEYKAKLEYENLIVQKIRAKYSLNEELAILRQRDTKPEEFKEYNIYVEQCKKEVKEKLKME